MNQKVTMRMIAERAGVSEATVSRVINQSDKVTAETAEKVNAVIKEMEYQPNELARSLRKKTTKTIGVVVSNILNTFFTSVVRGIEDVANQHEYKVIICNTDEKIEKEKSYVQDLINRNVDGLIVATTGNIQNYKELVGSTPVIFIDRIPHKSNIGDFDTILVENEYSTFKAVDFLIRDGYKDIAIITGNDISTTGFERLRGYKKALEKNNLPVREEYIKIGSFLGNDSELLTKEVLQNTKCDAIFAANQMILKGVLKVLTEFSIMPGEIGLFSFDDVEWLDFLNHKVNSIEQPSKEIGQAAMHRILLRIDGKGGEYAELRYPTNLVIRHKKNK